MRIVRLGREGFDLGEFDDVRPSRTDGLALQLDGLASLLGLAAAFRVRLDSGQD